MNKFKKIEYEKIICYLVLKKKKMENKIIF